MSHGWTEAEVREAEEERMAGETEPWIGVDLDGTLAEYHEWVAWNQIGPPIPLMIARVKKWLSEGKTVKIVTARVNVAAHLNYCVVTGEKFTVYEMVRVIQDWCELHIGKRLSTTASKDYNMVQLWDDRAVQVVPNTGRTLAEEHEAQMSALRGKAHG